MRILHVVTAWPRGPGDVITPWLVTLCEQLAARGHEVEVLAPSYRGLGGGRRGSILVHRFRYAPARWERLTHEEATPDRLARHPRYLLLVPPYLVAGALAGRRLGRRRAYDAVHVHWAIPHGVSGWLAARGSTRARRRRGGAQAPADPGCALVTTFYSAEVRWAERRFPLARPFLRWYCRRSWLVAISEAARALAAPYAAGPIEVIPYGVPYPEEAAGESPPPGAPPAAGPPLFLFVGRLVRRKGVDRLLEALALLADRPWRLEVVGFGPEREALEARAARLGLADRVAFLGRVSDEELAAAYRRATAFVLPATVDERADTEGLGVVLLEAMSHGVPVVATRRGGITDVVVEGESGVLVEDDVAALAEGLAIVLENPAAARALGEAGRRRVRRAFGWEGIVDRLEAVYARGAVERVAPRGPAGGE